MTQGLLAPVLFYLKRFVQVLWHNHPDLGWDTELTPQLANEWQEFTNKMNVLSEVSIPRYCSIPNSKQYLCVFSDASTSGFSSTAYLVSVVHINQINLL